MNRHVCNNIDNTCRHAWRRADQIEGHDLIAPVVQVQGHMRFCRVDALMQCLQAAQQRVCLQQVKPVPKDFSAHAMAVCGMIRLYSHTASSCAATAIREHCPMHATCQNWAPHRDGRPARVPCQFAVSCLACHLWLAGRLREPSQA